MTRVRPEQQTSAVDKAEGAASRRAARALGIGLTLAAAGALLALATAGNVNPFAGVLAVGAALVLVLGLMWASTGRWLAVELPACIGGLVAYAVSGGSKDIVSAIVLSPALWLGIAISVALAWRSPALRRAGAFRVAGAVALGLAALPMAGLVVAVQIIAWWALFIPHGA